VTVDEFKHLPDVDDFFEVEAARFFELLSGIFSGVVKQQEPALFGDGKLASLPVFHEVGVAIADSRRRYTLPCPRSNLPCGSK